MMNYNIFDIVSYYIISKKDFYLICNLRNVSIKFKEIIDNDILFVRKKYAYILNNVINKFGLTFNEIWEIIDHKNDFKYLMNCIYNIYTENDFSYFKNDYINKFNKSDKLNPLKNLPSFKYYQIKERMKNSILLNIALIHADYFYSIKKAREIDDYY